LNRKYQRAENLVHPRFVCHRLAQNDHVRCCEILGSILPPALPACADGMVSASRQARWYKEEQRTRRCMMSTRTANWSRRQIGLGKAAIWVLVEVSLLWIAPAAIGADEAITLLQTGKAKYKNVLVTDRDGTNIYIRHDGGLANVKIGDLPPDVQQSLGYATPEEDVSSQASGILGRVGKSAAFKIARSPGGATVKVGDFELQLTSADIIGIAVGAAVAYVIFCACSLLLCRKTGKEPGLLIWIPILQIFPLLGAAGMSWRWSLTF